MLIAFTDVAATHLGAIRDKVKTKDFHMTDVSKITAKLIVVLPLGGLFFVCTKHLMKISMKMSTCSDIRVTLAGRPV